MSYQRSQKNVFSKTVLGLLVVTGLSSGTDLHAAGWLQADFLSTTGLWASNHRKLVGFAAAIGVYTLARAIKAVVSNNTEAERLLGYDPQTDAIPEGKGKTALIIAHGFGDRKHRFDFENTKKATVVAFHFRDSRVNQRLYNFWFRNMNLGQEGDIRALLYHIIKCYQAGYKTISLFGHSRGGATCINTLDVFENPEKYPHIWQDFRTLLKITNDDIQKMRTALQKGTIFLARPLMSIDAATLCSVTRALSFMPAFTQTAIHWAAKKIFPFITSCKPTREEPIDIFDRTIKSEQNTYKFKIYLAKEDGEVSNRHNKQLFTLKRDFPEKVPTVSELSPRTLAFAFNKIKDKEQIPWQLRDVGFEKNPLKSAHIYIPEALEDVGKYLWGL